MYWLWLVLCSSIVGWILGTVASWYQLRRTDNLHYPFNWRIFAYGPGYFYWVMKLPENRERLLRWTP